MGRSRRNVAVTMLLITIVVGTAVADTLLPEGVNIQVVAPSESQESLKGVSIPRNPSTNMSRQLRVLEELELTEKKRKAEYVKKLAEREEKIMDSSYSQIQIMILSR